ncbi:MAG: tripartite tricarboxylate transporter substrate binding protein [Proteobacteria bacterium]|nr:tripartite tricarboxylate transporter substrate binding protein [Burkholderiales bacterium]
MNTPPAVRQWYAAAVCAALIAFAASPVSGQTWPIAPIRMVVPFAPGSTTDTVGRVIAAPLSASLGTPVVIDNRPGAGANLGAEIAARANPDGHTLLLANISHATSASLYAKLGYDFVRDFAPVTMLGSGAYFLVVHPSLPAKSLGDLVALARSKPTVLNIGSAGAGSYLWVENLQSLAGVKMTHVVYKGTPQVAAAVLSGEISAGAVATVVALPQVKAGRLRGLVVSSPQRSVMAPDTPTVTEAGFRGLEANVWYGLLVPAAVPREVINRLHAESVKALKLPDVRERFDSMDVRPVGSPPEQFGVFIREDIARWAKIVKQSGAKAE